MLEYGLINRNMATFVLPHDPSYELTPRWVKENKRTVPYPFTPIHQGKILIGGLPGSNSLTDLQVNENSYIQAPWSMFTVISNSYWEIPLAEVRIGSQKICCNNNASLIIDSGSTANGFPSKLLDKITRVVPAQTHCGATNRTQWLDDTFLDLTYVLVSKLTAHFACFSGRHGVHYATQRIFHVFPQYTEMPPKRLGS